MAITETRSLPPQFVEDLGKDYATQLTGLTALPLDTTKFQPMVAGQDQATKDAYSLAVSYVQWFNENHRQLITHDRLLSSAKKARRRRRARMERKLHNKFGIDKTRYMST